MTPYTDADLARKKAYISTLMNIATLFAQLDDISSSEGKYIVNKNMTQFSNLMNNKPVTALTGRAFADMLRSR